MDISDVANKDNELGNICRDANEYVIEINCWNNTTCFFKTVGCKYITHRVELVDEIGDITVEGNLYRFLTPDGEDTILEIEAEQIIQFK